MICGIDQFDDHKPNDSKLRRAKYTKEPTRRLQFYEPHVHNQQLGESIHYTNYQKNRILISNHPHEKKDNFESPYLLAKVSETCSVYI